MDAASSLDFHLAFYLGELVREDPGGVFRVVSKDSGFDPLMAHLQARGIDVERLDALGEEAHAGAGEPAETPIGTE